MANPVMTSVQYNGAAVYVFFDRAIAVTPGSELDGFTFTLAPGGVVVGTYSAVSDNILLLTIPAPITTEVLTVDYDDATGTVVDFVTADPADSFETDAVEIYATPLTLRATAGEGGDAILRIYFTEPVFSPTADLITGFTLTVDGVVQVLTAATASLNADQTQLLINVGVNFAYDQEVDIAYNAGTGDLTTMPSGAVASFTFADIPNLSQTGLPISQYPLSWVTRYPVTVVNNSAKASLGVSLNPIDILLVAKYGPVTIVTGGTFGVTVGNPAGISIPGVYANIVDGQLIEVSFTSTSTLWSVDAAKDWQAQTVFKIGQALNAIRALDQSIVFNSQTVDPV